MWNCPSGPRTTLGSRISFVPTVGARNARPSATRAPPGAILAAREVQAVFAVAGEVAEERTTSVAAQPCGTWTMSERAAHAARQSASKARTATGMAERIMRLAIPWRPGPPSDRLDSVLPQHPPLFHDQHLFHAGDNRRAMLLPHGHGTPTTRCHRHARDLDSPPARVAPSTCAPPAPWTTCGQADLARLDHTRLDLELFREHGSPPHPDRFCGLLPRARAPALPQRKGT